MPSDSSTTPSADDRAASDRQTDAERDIARRVTAPDMPAGHGDGLLGGLGRAIADTVGGSLPQALPPGTRSADEVAADDDDGDAAASPKPKPKG